MRESDIEKAICKFAREHDIRTSKRAVPNDRGFPDREFRRRGKVVYMELKAPKKRPSLLQEKRMRELREDGFAVAWFDEVDAACEWLRQQFMEDVGFFEI